MHIIFCIVVDGFVMRVGHLTISMMYVTVVKFYKFSTSNLWSVSSCRIRSERHAVELLTCDSKQKDCCYGTCCKCGVFLLEDHLRPLLQHDGQLKWYCWESKTVTFKGNQVLYAFSNILFFSKSFNYSETIFICTDAALTIATITTKILMLGSIRL